MLSQEPADKIKLFFGLPISANLGLNWQERIKNQAPLLAEKIRWSKKDNFHVTMRFLGYVAASGLSDLIAGAERVVRDISQFNFSAHNISHFPKINSPILAANIACNINLTQLFESLENFICALKYPPENRDFNPHVTLGRLRKSDKLYLQPIELDQIKIDAKELILYQSRASESGRDYVPLQRFSLA